jgi:ketosteroid isomerase-like protein
MSQQSVDILKAVMEAMARGEAAAFVQQTDPEIRIYPRPAEPGVRAVYEGWQGLEEYVVNWYSAWDEYDFEPLRFVDAGDQVVVVARERGRMAESGIEVVEEFSHSFRLRNERIIEWRMYDSHAEALEAVGLTAG